MGGLHCPQTQVREGACAIKVSMKKLSNYGQRVIYAEERRTDQVMVVCPCIADPVTSLSLGDDDVAFTADFAERQDARIQKLV
jgi:hypothetical protein